jgi:UV DNA damage endonuclease
MSENRPVQLGLCCLNTQLRAQKPPVFASRKMIIRTVKEQGIAALQEKITQNLSDVITMMHWNETNGIKVFRLSSELFPHKSNPKVDDYSFDFAESLLRQIGELAHKYNQRLTFHPGQYNVVGTPSETAFRQTCSDLKYHADVLDRCGLDGLNPVMVVHGGGIYNDKMATLERWCLQYQQLPENVKKYLVLENCEKCFSVEDCLWVSEKVNIPVVFDTHHYACYCQLHPNERFKPAAEYIPDILETWRRRGIKPKFHVSEQGAGRIGHHSDFIEVIPEYLMEIPERYGVEIDIMIEAKMKEQAISRLYEKYPKLNCKINISNVVSDNKIPGVGWVHKNCKTCDCCDRPRKKKLIITTH